MGSRLEGFDYRTPYFYMVTIKAVKGAMPFARVRDTPLPEDAVHCRRRSGTLTSPERYLEANAITHAFCTVIMQMHNFWRCIEPIETFQIMPDHLHLLIKLKRVPDPKSLPIIVRHLMRQLEKTYRLVASSIASAGGIPPLEHVFESEWHDWIIKTNGQLKAFTRYIRENPYRHWLRSCHREYFRRIGEIAFLGLKWFGYGNAALLDLPVIEPFRCSRKWHECGAEWNAAVARAERIGPGGAGIGTFMSPCEKICGNTIYRAGGALIVLSPEGFGERWHPPRNKEALCARGRMLFLSLYPETARQPTRKELYDRCHEMGDIVLGGLVKAN